MIYYSVFLNFTAIYLQNVNNTMQASYVYVPFLASIIFLTLCISRLKGSYYVSKFNWDYSLICIMLKTFELYMLFLLCGFKMLDNRRSFVLS